MMVHQADQLHYWQQGLAFQLDLDIPSVKSRPCYFLPCSPVPKFACLFSNLIHYLLVQRICAIYKYNCANNGKGLKIGTKKADTI